MIEISHRHYRKLENILSMSKEKGIFEGKGKGPGTVSSSGRVISKSIARVSLPFPQSLDPGGPGTASSSGRVISKSIARVSLPFPQSLDPGGPGTASSSGRVISKSIARAGLG